MRWLVTLAASKQDLEFLTAESLEGVSADPQDPRQLLLELDDPEGAATGDDIPHAAKAAIDAVVRNLNGLGRLRWGRTFEGVSISGVRSFDSAGGETQRVFIGPAYAHLLPEDFADIVERLGHPRPESPAGWDAIKALDLGAVTLLAETTPDVARVLHLVDLMLEGNEEIDWVAAYAALEVIEQDLAAREVNGQQLGWWTGSERSNFRATANSPEVLGFRARHGKNTGLTEARMTSKNACWFVRRVATYWLTSLLEADRPKASPDPVPIP